MRGGVSSAYADERARSKAMAKARIRGRSRRVRDG
jgi:hypothetical protein